MPRIRRLVGATAAVWLLSQTATLVAVPAVLWATTGPAAVECRCVHGEHAICPMHHRPARDGETCVIGSADAPALSTLSSILLASGPIVGPAPRAAKTVARPSLTADTTAASRRPAPPDPPPPRG